MNQFVRVVQNYLVWALPFVLGCMVWGTLVPENQIVASPAWFLWEVLAWNLMLWFAVLIVFLFFLVVSPSARETTLVRLAHLNERDEREAMITGRASRSAYLATLSLLAMLLFLSAFELRIQRLPTEEAVNGKTGTLSLGLHFQLFDSPPSQDVAQPNAVLFESKSIPLSKPAIVLLVLVWQIATFSYVARRYRAL